MEYRVGIGYDIHRFTQGRKLYLGGVNIPYAKGLSGHSDADVLLHAICDALLGAIGSGDIGEHFPDRDPKYRNISSVELLKKVCLRLKDRNFIIVNLDTIVVAEEPKLSLFKKEMRQRIAGVLNIREAAVNIKAKTNEGLGEVGKKKAVAAYATVIVKKEAL